MSSINEINNILSSIQMDRKDKAKLAKLLKNVGTNGANNVDVISISDKEVDEIIELYQKGIESDKHPLFTNYGIQCYINAYVDESYKEFALRTIWPDYDRIYIDYHEIYGEEFYEGANIINYDEEIVLNNNEITFQFRTLDECATHNFYLVVFDELGTHKINLNCFINHSGIITCIGDFSENEIIRIELDFNNYSTSYEIIAKSQKTPLVLTLNEYVDDLKNKVTEAIHNGTPLFIGTNNAYESVLKATCYSYDYGNVYLYTDYGKYEVVTDTIYELDTYEKVNIISVDTNTNFNTLKQKISLSSILRCYNTIFFVYYISSSYIQASGISTTYLGTSNIPIICNLRIYKDSTNGKCKPEISYIPNELVITDHGNMPSGNKSSMNYGEYMRLIPTKDLNIDLLDSNNVSVFADENFALKYAGEIIFEDTVYNITFNDVVWSTDSILDFKPNHTYRFEIRCGLGVMKEFVNA